MVKLYQFITKSVCPVEAETEEQARVIFDEDHCHCDVEEVKVTEIDLGE